MIIRSVTTGPWICNMQESGGWLWFLAPYWAMASTISQGYVLMNTFSWIRSRGYVLVDTFSWIWSCGYVLVHRHSLAGMVSFADTFCCIVAFALGQNVALSKGREWLQSNSRVTSPGTSPGTSPSRLSSSGTYLGRTNGGLTAPFQSPELRTGLAVWQES